MIAYLLPIVNWLFHVINKSKIQKIQNIKDFGENIWFFRHRRPILLSEIRSKLTEMEQKAKKRLSIYFIIGLPSLWFLINIILIKYIGSYYIKRKYNFEMPSTGIFNYVGTLVLLSIWTSGVLLNKLLIIRINMLVKKTTELEAASDENKLSTK
jgi:hypothetical protein